MAGGVKEEVSGIFYLNESFYVVNFNELEVGSDLWLFDKTTDFGENMENLQIILTQGFDGRVWYEKNPEENILTIYGTDSGEVSFRMTGNRFDWKEWSNFADPEDNSPGLTVPLKNLKEKIKGIWR